MGVIVRKLGNGLTVMLSENHEEPRIYCRILTRAGSAKDPHDATGLAHYLEHMLFKGTSKLGTLDWAAEKPHLDRIAALYDELFRTKDAAKREALYKQIDAENQAASAYVAPNEMDTLYDAWGVREVNAQTTNDDTSYFCEIPSNRLESWARMETGRFSDPVFRLFQTELESVYEEKNRGMDNPNWAISEAFQAAMFPEHPYGTQTTIGTVEHLKNPSLTKITEYFRTWYVPNNMVVALAGDLDPRETLAVLERTLGTLEPRPVPPDPSEPIRPPVGVRRVEVKFEAEDQVRIGFLTVAEGHPDHDPLLLADTMLDNEKTGLINVNLTGIAQKVQQANSTHATEAQAGYEFIWGTAKEGQTCEEVEKLLLEQVELLKKGQFSEGDLVAAITSYEVGTKKAIEENQARTRWMTASFVNRSPWAQQVGQIERLRKVTKADVVRVANRYFNGDYVVAYRRRGQPELPKIAKPGFTPVDIKADRHSAAFQELVGSSVRPIEPHFIQAGRDYTSTDLRTGKLIWVRNPMNDLFKLSFVFDIGTDDDERISLAFALMDLGGAGALDPVAYKRRLFETGTEISVGAGRDETTVTVTGLESNLGESLKLLRDHFTQPNGVGQADLDKLVARIVGSRPRQKTDNRALSGALMGHAMRGPDSDTLRAPRNEVLQAWKAEDLFGAARSIWDLTRTVQYVGTRTMQDVARILDLPPLPGGAAAVKAPPARRSVAYVVPAKPRLLFVDRKMAQVQVGLFYPDGLYDRPMVPVQRAYNEYMSGSMGSVVFQEIRESRALAYDAGAAYRMAARPGDANVFLAVLGTQADKTLEALEVLMRIVREMPAAEARMANVKSSLDESYRTARIGFRDLPAVVLAWWRQGFDADPRPWNWNRIKELTLPELVQFASRWKDKPYTITILGDKSRLDMAQLAKYGELVEVTPDQLFNW
jgi:predicted Zn-dependent peptidase